MPAVLRFVLSLCLLCLSFAAPAQTTLRNEQVQVELLAHAPQGVQAGQTIWLGLKIEHAPHWHTYWQNPGDSGLPTQLHWQLPAGLQAGEIAWPLPKKIPIGSLANYGYEGTLLLAVPVTVTPQFQPPVTGKLRVELQAEWLVCRQECIPQEGRLALDLPVRSATALHGALFDAAQAATPQVLTSTQTGSNIARLSEDGQALQLRIEQLPADWRGQTLTLLPVTAGVVNNAAPQGQGWTQQWDGNRWTASVPVSSERSEGPARMQWVLARGPETSPRPPALQVDTPVQGQWPALAAAGGVSPELARALEVNAQTAPASQTGVTGFGLALLGAFLGGLILNLMPCVFPVLAIKLLGFSRPGVTPSQHRAAGLAYSGGAVLSFVLLGGLLLALRAAGEQLGWGFQLQSPGVVTALAVLFTLLGLNLAGLFEFGQMLPSSLAGLQSRHPMVDAALSGVLAVAVASPCTAPFMGASLGLAVSLPALQALAIFAVMGLGMALPYLAVSFWPALAHRLPRPGAWMATFRQAMAFPMFATVVWLVWVLGQQSGMDSAAALLAALVLLAFGLWAATHQGRTRIGLLALAALLGAGLISQWPAAETAQGPTAQSSERWSAWSEATVQRELAAGRTVFVDFTAAWCVTCQYNKKTVLASTEVLAAFDSRQVVSLRADWTRRDAAITRALGALGRSGVPVYAVYAPGRAPQVLSELPSATEILRALP
jgi:thiol:disulfide interchange protein/DsbC/DsbD-like thiol-disulfide interchange protein